ncbi:hypothetical protein GCK72_007718 [Caenorhabditis remanei]|uniref:Uncharacterized protein n=1 Tax=Caenorhabditis remanei TaxID=31234 RepID=A0A6A5HJS9_CAERE|nr:hypothetical protein GCK72_007718 [Caenorhabditis remanei]KAF1767759.1 hypothetical protein GCK72_007718 [Caenorhabditis remanei]
MDGPYGVLLLTGQVGPFCRAYYQSDKYAKCAKDDTCAGNNDYHFCCVYNNYCNFYSTNWFFWLMFFLVAFIIVGCIGVCIWRCRKNRRGGGEENYEEPDDTV